MSDKKVSIVLLGREDSRKKALITDIMGKDLSEIPKTNVLKKTAIYENDTYKIFFTPDLQRKSDDIKNVLAIHQNPDMSLLLIKDGLSVGEVKQQMNKLEKTTKKPTKEFTVVLPHGSNQSDTYHFNCLTTDQVFNELRKLAEERGLVSIRERSADNTGSSMSTRETPIDETGVVFKDGCSSNDRKSFKRTHTDTPVNLVLLGTCGTGKSASGNTILGGNHFASKASSQPVTRECQMEETVIDGKRVRVIDTPDMFGDDIEQSDKNKHVQRCRELCQSGPCVFVLVMHISRFTDGERDIMKKLERAFGHRVQEETVILFTRGDDLKRERMRLENFLSSCQPDLLKIVEQCENRCVVFENRTSDLQQVMKLMQKVENVLEKQQELSVNRTQSCSCMTFPWFR